MKYQYKIIGLVGKMYDRRNFYKFETEQPYPISVGDEIWFPEDWKEAQGGGYTWKVKKIEHYIVENFVVIYVVQED